MTKVSAFHSVNEKNKDPTKRVHHDNNLCAPGRDIPSWERQAGSNGYRLCDVCAEYDRTGR